jgi:hypothetical protein
MAQTITIIGLPGVGKTTFLRRLSGFKPFAKYYPSGYSSEQITLYIDNMCVNILVNVCECGADYIIYMYDNRTSTYDYVLNLSKVTKKPFVLYNSSLNKGIDLLIEILFKTIPKRLTLISAIECNKMKKNLDKILPNQILQIINCLHNL